jgi:hypothetical protein
MQYFFGKENEMKEFNNDLLSRKEVADYLGVCITTLMRLDIPQTRIRRRVFYLQSQVDKWLMEQTARSGQHEFKK